MIEVRKPSDQELNSLNVKSWPIWTKEKSRFSWHYDEKETCYILEGEVIVRYAGKEVKFGRGDLVVFPEGLSCEWEIIKDVKKHYKFG